jgi:hypothetical protein
MLRSTRVVGVYDRLRGLLADDDDVTGAYPAVDRAFAEGWSDPRMDEYDRYEELHQCIKRGDVVLAWPPSSGHSHRRGYRMSGPCA